MRHSTMGELRKIDSMQRAIKVARQKHAPEVLSAGMYPSLPSLEAALYIFLWTYAVFRATYTSYRSALDFRPYFSNQDFIKGWSIFGKEKDNTDYEWSVWSVKYITFIPWVISFIIVSQLFWWKFPQLITYYYVVFAAACLHHFLGWLPTIFLFCQPLLMFVVQFTRRKIFCWAAGLLFLVLVNVHPFTQLREFIVPSYTEKEYIMSVITAWTNTRCLSFCLHRCTEKRKSTSSVLEDLVLLLGFCFYFPLLYTGPLMMFDDFEKQMLETKPQWTTQRLLYIVANIARYVFWFMFNEFIVHHVYTSSLHTYPQYVQQLSAFGLCGLAFTASQFFMTKYTVLYGMPGIIAQIENYKPPPKPKCIARIHLYSDMWRYFDQGLYSFLKKYIYVPAIGEKPGVLRKLFASAVTFSFIYIWHGTAYFIFLWSLLNYIGIVLEVVATSVGSSESFTQFEAKYLTPEWSRRLRAFIATPLLMMSTLSNFYFLLGYDVGNILVDRLIVKASAFNLCVTFSFMYCMSQVSIEAKNWELSKLQKSKGR